MKQQNGLLSSMRPLILIVDDSTVMLYVLEEILSRTYDIIKAHDGDEALSLIQTRMPDAIITDLLMPEKDGYALISNIRSNTRISHIPVIMLTAVNTDFNKLEGYRSGADAYLTKPFNKEELLLILARFITSRQDIIAHSKREMQFGENNGVSMDDDFIRKLDKVLEKNLGKSELKVSDIAKDLSISLSTFERRVKQLLNTKPAYYLRDYRLLRSQQMLKQRRGRVKEIAAACGFRNVPYFSVCFKQRFGVSPSDYLGMNK